MHFWNAPLKAEYWVNLGSVKVSIQWHFDFLSYCGALIIPGKIPFTPTRSITNKCGTTVSNISDWWRNQSRGKNFMKRFGDDWSTPMDNHIDTFWTRFWINASCFCEVLCQFSKMCNGFGEISSHTHVHTCSLVVVIRTEKTFSVYKKVLTRFALLLPGLQSVVHPPEYTEFACIILGSMFLKSF